MNQSVAAFLTANWPGGVCHFCGIDEERVDGDRVRWFDESRTVCSQPGCISRFRVEIERWIARHPRPRKLTPAEVHERIREEAKRKRRQYREAAKARRKGRVA